NEHTGTTLQLSYIANVHQLMKDIDDVYELEGDNVLRVDHTDAMYTVSQGALEGSNVDGTQAMTDMMSAYRSFEQNQKVLQAYDQSMGKAVSEIARLR